MADNNREQGGGGSLRWWRQQEPETTRPTASRWYAAQPPLESAVSTPPLAQASLVEPIDIGDELEAEALRRATLEKRHNEEGWVVKGTYAKRTRLMRNRLALVFALGVISELALYAIAPSPIFLWIIFGLALYVSFLYTMVAAKLNKLAPPEVSVSPVGISVTGPNYSGMLRWHEIESIERHRISGVPMIVIKPKDPARMEHFTYTKRGAKLRKIRQQMRWLYGKLPEAVYLDENTLPLSADAFLTRVAAFQSGPILARK